jgi:hypothetical protein
MFRALLIWLLVLALPAQGAIAATLVFCGPNHHGSAGTAVTAHDAQAQHHDHSHTAQTHDHSADGAAGDTASAESAAPETFGQAGTKKCSACASCCSAATICSTVPGLPILEPGSTVFAAVVPVIAAFVADGPDRPPRHSLA